jgi:hypothetical protein
MARRTRPVDLKPALVAASRDRTVDPIRIGQRVHLLRGSRAKLLWDRAGYSAHVAADAEGVVTGYELLDRDGYLTTDAIQELRGYPGTPAYEVAFLVTRPGLFSDSPDSLAEAWAYVTADDLAIVDVRGRRSHPHGEDVESRLRTIAAEAVRPLPPIKVRGPKSWARPARRQQATEDDDLEESAVVDELVVDVDLLVAGSEELIR